MSDQLVKVESQIQRIEDALLHKATLIQDMNHFLLFYYSYMNAYVPLLEFAVEALPERSIARIANFGMLIDHLSSVHLNRAMAFQVDSLAREVSLRTSQEPRQVLALLSDLAIAQKVSIAGTVITAHSCSRDMTLCAAQSKFSALNKIVTWANIFGHVLRFPSLAELMFTPEDIEIAATQLRGAHDRIKDRARSYDRELAIEWSNSVDLPQRVIEGIPKYFVGAKVTWLLAMQGLEATRCILTKDKEAATRALGYNEKLDALLAQTTLGTDEWSYRDLNAGGPCCDLKHLISRDPGDISIRIVSSHELLVRTQTSEFLLQIPGTFFFFTNRRMQVQLDATHKILFENDPNAITHFYKNPAMFFVHNWRNLSSPSECTLRAMVRHEREVIQMLEKESASVSVSLKVAYGEKLNDHIVELIGRLTESALEASMLYGLVYGLERLALANGIDLGQWTGARWAIAVALLSKLRPLVGKAKEVSSEDVDKVRQEAAKTVLPMTAEERIRRLNMKTSESHSEMCEAIEELKDSGLVEIMRTVAQIRDILLSGLSPEETMQKLAPICRLLEAGNDGDGQRAKAKVKKKVSKRAAPKKASRGRKAAQPANATDANEEKAAVTKGPKRGTKAKKTKRPKSAG